MKLSRILLILGVIAHIIMYVLVVSYSKAILLLIYASAILWGCTFILALLFFFNFKNRLPDNKALRVLGFFLCTPLLSLSLPFVGDFMKKEEFETRPLVSNAYEFRNGVVWKYSEMRDVDGADYVITFHKGMEYEFRRRGDKALLKDSIWVYYTHSGDTIKMEYYKNGIRLKTIE